MIAHRVLSLILILTLLLASLPGPVRASEVADAEPARAETSLPETLEGVRALRARPNPLSRSPAPKSALNFLREGYTINGFFTRFSRVLLLYWCQMTSEKDYVAYLLRLWRVNSQGKTTWRASVESASTGERMGFTSLDDLFGFLRQETGNSSDSGESATGPEPTCETGY